MTARPSKRGSRHLQGLLVVMSAAGMTVAACASSGATDAPTSLAAPVTSAPATSSPDTSTAGSSATSPAPTSPSTSVADDGCGTVLPSTSLPGEGHQTVMTIAPVTSPLSYLVDSDPRAACPGAHVVLTVHAHNSGASEETAGVGIVVGPIPHIALGEVGPFTVPPHGDAVAQLTIVVPLLAPGAWPIALVGGSAEDGSVTVGWLTVKRPN